MPYKHSEERRHKFEKPHYKVTNWPAYNAALKRRGDFTMWFTEEAIAEWCPAKTGVVELIDARQKRVLSH